VTSGNYNINSEQSEQNLAKRPTPYVVVVVVVVVAAAAR